MRDHEEEGGIRTPATAVPSVGRERVGQDTGAALFERWAGGRVGVSASASAQECGWELVGGLGLRGFVVDADASACDEGGSGEVEGMARELRAEWESGGRCSDGGEGGGGGLSEEV